jgi:hypothetical protein
MRGVLFQAPSQCHCKCLALHHAGMIQGTPQGSLSDMLWWRALDAVFNHQLRVCQQVFVLQRCQGLEVCALFGFPSLLKAVVPVTEWVLGRVLERAGLASPALRHCGHPCTCGGSTHCKAHGGSILSTLALL